MKSSINILKDDDDDDDEILSRVPCLNLLHYFRPTCNFPSTHLHICLPERGKELEGERPREILLLCK